MEKICSTDTAQQYIYFHIPVYKVVLRTVYVIPKLAASGELFTPFPPSYTDFSNEASETQVT